MKKKLLKTGSLLLGLLLLCGAVVPLNAEAASKPSRTINLVYDDSGSMIEDTTGYQDRWCQAKYALEVFAAMLEETDTMNVYAMSDFSYPADDYSGVGPYLSLSGSASPAENVAAVHQKVTGAHSTPFQTVEKAYADLTGASTDEKWLVVLTDGEFTKDFTSVLDISEVDNFFYQKDEDISVMYLALGGTAVSIAPNESRNIFAYSAANNTDILKKLTEMSNRIFERNRLLVDPASGRFSFDIPMGELIVFAQGKNVSVKGIAPDGGAAIAPDSEPVEVRYSEVAATNYADDPNVIVNDNLVGRVAYFTGDFDAGEYTVDAPGADTIEVYYRPNVDIAVHLTNSEGMRLSTGDPIPQGTYQLEYGFVKPGTDTVLPESKLLGTVDFSAAVTINGSSDGRRYGSGDSITVKEGTLDIEATAEYLDYNTVATSLHYDIFRNKSIVMTQQNVPVYQLSKTARGFENADTPIGISAVLSDRDITPEEWKELGVPEIELFADSDFYTAEVLKADTPGQYEIRLHFSGDLPNHRLSGTHNFHLSILQKMGQAVWAGNMDGSLELRDERPWYDVIPGWVIPSAIGILLAILLFLFWITRKVLPKNIRLQPSTTKFVVGFSPQQGLEATVAYSRKSKTLKVQSPPCTVDASAECGVKLTLEPVDRRYVKSAKRRIKIIKIRSEGNACTITISNVPYVQDEHGNWIEETKARKPGGAQMQGKVVHNAQIEIKTQSSNGTKSRCECRLKHI